MNALRAHDLLWGMTPAMLPGDAPLWALQVLEQGLPVVVRRADCAEGWVAVGVRGEGRERRYAAYLRTQDVTQVKRPEQIVTRAQVGPVARWPALDALASVARVLDSSHLAWGPTGGVGYQLATGIEVLHADSDLDLLLRTPQPLARQAARDLLEILECAPCRVDLQLETPSGAVALREWAGRARRVLLKAANGARLVIDPWAALECAA